jgi:phosphate transport system ATP-binding protein
MVEAPPLRNVPEEAAGRPAPDPAPRTAVLEARELTVTAGARTIVHQVGLRIAAGEVFALIGPSGAGKSTLLRCLNRLIDLTPELTVAGDVLFHGRSIYGGWGPADDLRARIGILFQQPVVFPQSLEKNVLFGVRRLGTVPRSRWPETVERALTEVALWSEVKDRLREPAAKLSIGQQQRLCLARTLAVDPEVVLMDEPTSALDPRSTEAIEELLLRGKGRRTVVLVSHNLAQVERVADRLACLCVRDGRGEIEQSAGGEPGFARPECRAAVDDLAGTRPSC